MYVCGPTVYDSPHIGNARPPIVFDILNRLLSHSYKDVLYVRNYTDVDDKILARSKEQNIDPKILTEKYINVYQNLMGKLGVKKPNIMPKVTESIQSIISMIENLIFTKYAYFTQGHVYFDTSKINERILIKDLDQNISRIKESLYKKDQKDFVLWKPSGDDIGWSSPWGKGRPGWHIECSAMILEHIGKTIDIHGGGQDLIFPHHESECQQSYAHNDAPLANYWVHNAIVLINGTKMSKSLNNFITIEDILNKYSGDVFKFSMLHTHYRHPFDFRWERLDSAKNVLDRLINKSNNIEGVIDQDFLSFLMDDLNTPMAIKRLHEMPVENIKASLAFIGISKKSDSISIEQKNLIDKRNKTRLNKDWIKSDSIRDILLDQGIILEDNGNETLWKKA